MNNEADPILRYPARVLGCLRPGHISVIMGSGQGLADGGIVHEVPLELIPLDLRLPNAEFTVLLDRRNHRIVGVER